MARNGSEERKESACTVRSLSHLHLSLADCQECRPCKKCSVHFPFPLVVNFRQQKPWWGFKNLVAGTVDTVGVEHRLVDHILAAVAVAADHIAAVAAEEVVQRWEHCQKSQN